ncbi:hypothetical protein PMIN06_009093 [Paraphaeosphaeria minitans]|uniref:AA1-like domain-containing protein n=1 Tax=Paraphaeosphaeria minitans TaxID=565426 RepID=A0A9P6GM41_9PLEO|nr:hypothetical protein PMIN01_03207 [Paraphaeosphaeria minitans]
MNLLPVLLLAPLALSLPSPHLHRAQNHTFHLSNLTYSSTLLYSTPSHLAVSSATFSFAFSNPAAYPAQCIGHSSGQTNDAGFFAWPQIFTCTNEGAAVGHVTFAWDRYGGGVLSVKQTWECGGDTYLGTATTDVRLRCRTTFWQNPNFTWPDPGWPYSAADTTCDVLDLSVEPRVERLE